MNLSASSTAKTLAGLNVLDTSKHRWSDLSGTIHGEQPTPRYSHGFTSAGGKLYLHGGIGNEGAGTVPPIPSANPYWSLHSFCVALKTYPNKTIFFLYFLMMWSGKSTGFSFTYIHHYCQVQLVTCTYLILWVAPGLWQLVVSATQHLHHDLIMDLFPVGGSFMFMQAGACMVRIRQQQIY